MAFRAAAKRRWNMRTFSDVPMGLRKPENVLLASCCDHSTARLIDFGLASLKTDEDYEPRLQPRAAPGCLSNCGEFRAIWKVSVTLSRTGNLGFCWGCWEFQLGHIIGQVTGLIAAFLFDRMTHPKPRFMDLSA